MIDFKKPKKISLRELNEEGLRKFFNVMDNINKIKKNKTKTPEKVFELLEDLPKVNDEFSMELFNAPELDLTLDFKDRYYFSKYLHNTLNNYINEKGYRNNFGMWAWIALSYLEILTNDFKNILEKYHYLPDAGILQRDTGVPLLYRHSVRESYILYNNFKEESKIYFSRNTMSKMSDFLEQTRGYSKLRRHKSLHAYLVKKYLDPKTGYLKTGAASKVLPEQDKGRGSVRRVGPIYECLAVSYAAPLLSASQLGELLGKGLEIE